MFRDSDFVASLSRSETCFVLLQFKILHTNISKMQILSKEKDKKTAVYTLSLWLQHVKIDKKYSYDISL